MKNKILCALALGCVGYLVYSMNKEEQELDEKSKENQEIINELHNAINDSNDVTLNKQRQLIIALVKDNLDEVKKAVEDGADVQYSLKEYDDFLKFFPERSNSYCSGSHRICSLLADNYNPVEIATILNSSPIVDYLLKNSDYNQDIDIKNRHGRTLLMLAAWYNRPDILQLLLKYKANPNAHTDSESVLSLAIDIFEDSPESISSHREGFDLLIQAGADINFNKLDVYTLLGVAANIKKVNITKFLLDRKADPNIPNKYGLTPLLDIMNDLPNAQDNDNDESLTKVISIIKLLLEYKADPNTESHGITPLILAVNKNYPQIVDLLVAAGADVNKKYKTYYPLTIADNYNKDIFELLLKTGKVHDYIKDLALLSAIETGRTDIINILLKYGTDPNAQDEKGNTALILSVIYNNIDVMKLLIAHKADLNVLNNSGYSVLGAALQYDNFDMVNLLVDAGASRDTLDDEEKEKLDTMRKAKHSVFMKL